MDCFYDAPSEQSAYSDNSLVFDFIPLTDLCFTASFLITSLSQTECVNVPLRVGLFSSPYRRDFFPPFNSLLPPPLRTASHCFLLFRSPLRNLVQHFFFSSSDQLPRRPNYITRTEFGAPDHLQYLPLPSSPCYLHGVPITGCMYDVGCILTPSLLPALGLLACTAWLEGGGGRRRLWSKQVKGKSSSPSGAGEGNSSSAWCLNPPFSLDAAAPFPSSFFSRLLLWISTPLVPPPPPPLPPTNSLPRRKADSLHFASVRRTAVKRGGGREEGHLGSFGCSSVDRRRRFVRL